MFKYLVITFFITVNIFANYIKDNCYNEYNIYKNIIEKYVVRIEDSVKERGCKVVPIYASIIESNNFEILDLIEDDKLLIDNLVKIFYQNKFLSKILFKDKVLKYIILHNGLNEKFVNNFLYLLEKKFDYYEKKQIKKNKTYLNYFLLSAFYANSPKETLNIYNKLTTSISIDLLPSFSLILSTIGNDYKFEDLVESFSNINKEISIDAIKKISKYPEFFIYFLYPKKVDLDINEISNYKLRKIQRDIQKKSIFIFSTMYEKYRYSSNINQIDYALLTLKYLYPYLLDDYKVNYLDFVMIFEKLIQKEYILSLFEEDKCSKKIEENFAIFGRNNISNLSNLIKHESYFSSKLFSSLNNKSKIFSLFYIANFYNTYSKEEWKLFKNLLINLPYNYEYKVAFLHKLEEIKYFEKILSISDYDAKVSSSNKKYIFILTTPYPGKNDLSIYDQFLMNKIDNEKLAKYINELKRKDIEELIKHNFTNFDKFAVIADNIDNAIMVASIVSAPFTGGASLAGVAFATAKKGVKSLAKKGFKYMIKKVTIKRVKLAYKLTKSIYKIKKFKNTFGKKYIKNGNSFDKIDNTNDVLQYSIIAGKMLYLYYNNKQLEIKQICEER
jgi:hypothetical protein